jgi:hypothetical protein
MTNFEASKNPRPEHGIATFGRFLVTIVLFLGGIVLSGIGASTTGAPAAGGSVASDIPWLPLVIGLICFCAAIGLPMRGVSRK